MKHMSPVRNFKWSLLVLFKKNVDENVLLLLFEPIDVVTIFIRFRPRDHIYYLLSMLQ